jgi:hypothetical protein
MTGLTPLLGATVRIGLYSPRLNSVPALSVGGNSE